MTSAITTGIMTPIGAEDFTLLPLEKKRTGEFHLSLTNFLLA